MKNLTFPGFLKKYVMELSVRRTLSLSSLIEDVKNGNARLLEPLTLYAVFSGKGERYYKLISAAKLSDKTLFFPSPSQLLNDLKEETVPYNYVKVWKSYLSAADKQRTEDEIKSLVRSRVIQIQKEKSITNYRIYTALHLNPGNVNSWLKNGNEKKIALSTGRKILDYVEKYR